MQCRHTPGQYLRHFLDLFQAHAIWNLSPLFDESVESPASSHVQIAPHIVDLILIGLPDFLVNLTQAGSLSMARRQVRSDDLGKLLQPRFIRPGELRWIARADFVFAQQDPGARQSTVRIGDGYGQERFALARSQMVELPDVFAAPGPMFPNIRTGPAQWLPRCCNVAKQA